MEKQKNILNRFLIWSARAAGRPITFVVAMGIILVWLILGYIYGFSARWLLIIDTVATINASLMVFIIQNTQVRENRALHLKIDELIRVTKEAENELIAIEQMEEEELESIRKKLFKEPPAV